LTAPPGTPPESRPDVALRVLWILAALVTAYLLVAYVALPRFWRWRMSRVHVSSASPRVTVTALGVPGDPLNIALAGSEEAVDQGLLAAGWHPADPITFRSSLAIARSTVLHSPYDDAPVSDLFLWDRKQDLAFEQLAGRDARRRHHVRFWRSTEKDPDGRPLWFGAATYDRRVGLSRVTGQITHRIGAEIDLERDKLVRDLTDAGRAQAVYWRDRFQERLQGKNGGGDPYRTDGRLAIVLLAPQ
jgi:LssY C-terminus